MRGLRAVQEEYRRCTRCARASPRLAGRWGNPGTTAASRWLHAVIRPHGHISMTASAAKDASWFSRLTLCQSPSCAFAIRSARRVKISCICDGLQSAKCESLNQSPPPADQIVPSRNCQPLVSSNSTNRVFCASVNGMARMWPNSRAEWCRANGARMQTGARTRHPLQHDS
jgi:hypothetical protein